MRYLSEMIIYRFNDMQDWSLINRGLLDSKQISFNLRNKLRHVKSIMEFFAEEKKISLVFDVDFSTNFDFFDANR